MDETIKPTASPSGRLPKGYLRKLKHPKNNPDDPRSGRVTLTTPLRDLQALDLILEFLQNQVEAPPRVNRSTIIRALVRFARQQLTPVGDQVKTPLGREIFAGIGLNLVEIDAESFR